MNEGGNGPQFNFRGENPQQAGDRVPGHAYNRLDEYRAALATKVREVQVHNKTVRLLAAKYPGLHADMLNSLAIVDTYLILHKRQRQSIEHVLDWSGANTKWKRKIGRGITELILEGYLIGEGKSVSISEEGARILEDYNVKFEEAKQTYIDRAIKAAAKKKVKK